MTKNPGPKKLVRWGGKRTKGKKNLKKKRKGHEGGRGKWGGWGPPLITERDGVGFC